MNAPNGEGTFLLEVGCEEIPALMLPAALRALTEQLLLRVREAGLGGAADPVPPYGGPRRLVAVLTGIAAREEDREVVVTGPPVAVAFGPDGAPTRAAVGFAKAQGVPVEALEKVKGEKGETIAARRRVVGRTASEVLAKACPEILGGMRFPKTMKWGDQGHCFVRPVHWIVALFDDAIVDLSFMGIRSSRQTRGHRFLSPGPHAIPSADQYEAVLRDTGHVIARVTDRRQRIKDARERAARASGWTIQEDEPLLEELTHLTEWPGVIAGSFPEALLALPETVLVTSMRHHQKYFVARLEDGQLAPGFFAVINQENDRDGSIRRGNEWVLRARLADAAFFWGEDRKRTLESRLPDLSRVTFQEKLGSALARSQRLESLAGSIADWLGASAAEAQSARMAARLAKADLTTGLVGEFPELQGAVGALYARSDGHPEAVARAIEEHYLPTSLAGARPATLPGCIVALADKLDLLAGCFAAGLLPKGSADPLGLRRAAQGFCLILNTPPAAEAKGIVSLARAIQTSLSLYAAQGMHPEDERAAASALVEFFSHRLRYMMEERGMRTDTARACLSAGADDVRDVWQRAAALTKLRDPASRGGEDFTALAASAKRIRNILAQAREKGIAVAGQQIVWSLLSEPSEVALYDAVEKAGASVEEKSATGDHLGALRNIAALRPKVDDFFEKVLVMAREPDVRSNRLTLLYLLSSLLSRVADFAEIMVEGETARRDA